MNVLKLLKKDHDILRGLFQKLDRSGKAYDKRKETFEQLRKHLQLHIQAEEEIFYPAIKALNGRGRRLATEALREHREIDELLTQIGRFEVDDPRFGDKLEILLESVDHHVEEEEGQVFQFAEKNCPEDLLESLAFEVEERKKVLLRRFAA